MLNGPCFLACFQDHASHFISLSLLPLENQALPKVYHKNSVCCWWILLCMFVLCTGVHIQRLMRIPLESFSFSRNFDKPILLFEILLKAGRKGSEALMFKSLQQLSVLWLRQLLDALLLWDISAMKQRLRHSSSGTHCSKKHPAVSPSQNLTLRKPAT